MTLYEAADHRFLPEFSRTMVETPDGPILALVAGSGPPVLMLHGDPQTHLCWQHIAPGLSKTHTVVLTDIRGRGESHKPGVSDDHRHYSKRTMAAEQIAVMKHLGHDRFDLVGHDRGGRVARRMALDRPDTIKSLTVMDIVPALDFYERANAAIAQDYFYFFFLTQPTPHPERLIAGDPRAFMAEILLSHTKDDCPYDAQALEAYLQAATSVASITAMCECFRAGRTCDMEDDIADRVAGRKVLCPTLVMWGETGVVGRHFDVRVIWGQWADDIAFAPMPCGHFIPEEAPGLAGKTLTDFLSGRMP